MIKLTTRESFHTYADVLRSLTPFKTSGSLAGVVCNPQYGAGSYGILPDLQRSAIKADRPDYVIYSYATPIAWHATEPVPHWECPRVSYSMTTSRQQGRIRPACALLNTETGVIAPEPEHVPAPRRRASKSEPEALAL